MRRWFVAVLLLLGLAALSGASCRPAAAGAQEAELEPARWSVTCWRMDGEVVASAIADEEPFTYSSGWQVSWKSGGTRARVLGATCVVLELP